MLICLSIFNSAFAILTTPNQVAPTNGAINQNVNVILDWNAVTGMTGYQYQYDTSPSFNSPDFFNGNLGNTSQVTLANLQFNTTYYWHVRSVDTATVSIWSVTYSFTTDILSGIQSINNKGLVCKVNNQHLIITTEQDIIRAVCEIYNTAGQLVNQEKLINTQTEIEINNWRKGIYFVFIANSKSNQSFKLLVQ